VTGGHTPADLRDEGGHAPRWLALQASADHRRRAIERQDRPNRSPAPSRSRHEQVRDCFRFGTQRSSRCAERQAAVTTWNELRPAGDLHERAPLWPFGRGSCSLRAAPCCNCPGGGSLRELSGSRPDWRSGPRNEAARASKFTSGPAPAASRLTEITPKLAATGAVVDGRKRSSGVSGAGQPLVAKALAGSAAMNMAEAIVGSTLRR
jgi:hypothetical protein